MKPSTPLVYVIQAEDPPLALKSRFGSQADWFTQALSQVNSPIQVIRPHAGDPLPAADDPHPVIISGSWAMVTDKADWSEALASWIRLRYASEAPLLGVCYGHQLMAYALGGLVHYHPKGRELGCLPVWQVPLSLNEHEQALLKGLPTRFYTFLTHQQTVLQPPPQARILLRSSHDTHQMLSYRAGFYSVQFHPEFTTPLLAACIHGRAEQLAQEGYVVQDLLDGLQATPEARTLLERFIRLYSPVLTEERKNSPGVTPIKSLKATTNADILS